MTLSIKRIVLTLYSLKHIRGVISPETPSKISKVQGALLYLQNEAEAKEA